MYQDVVKTNYPPQRKPILVYDGNCGFCKYWVIKWKKLTRDTISYEPYQKVAVQFKDLSEEHFERAVRLILKNGRIISGPAVAYYTNQDKQIFSVLFQFYETNTWFRRFSDKCYNWIANHRRFMYRLSVTMFGKNPKRTKPLWLIYLGLITVIIYGITSSVSQ